MSSLYTNLDDYIIESHQINKWCYYRQTIFNQLNIIVPYVDIIGLCSKLLQLYENLCDAA